MNIECNIEKCRFYENGICGIDSPEIITGLSPAGEFVVCMDYQNDEEDEDWQ